MSPGNDTGALYDLRQILNGPVRKKMFTGGTANSHSLASTSYSPEPRNHPANFFPAVRGVHALTSNS